MIEQKIYEIAKQGNKVYDCHTFEDGKCIKLNVLFDDDEENCLDLLEQICIKITMEVNDLGFEINPYFIEATFYLK